MKILKNKKALLIIVISIILICIVSIVLYICSSHRVYEALDNMSSYNSYSLKIDFYNKTNDIMDTDLEVKTSKDIEYVKNNLQTYYNYEKKLILPFYKEEDTIWYYKENIEDDFYIDNYYNFYKELFNELKKFKYKKTLKGYKIQNEDMKSLESYMKEIYLRNRESVGITDKQGQYQMKDTISTFEVILNKKRLEKMVITYTFKCYDEKGNSFDCDELDYEIPQNEIVVTFDNYNDTKIKIPSDIKQSIEEI